MQEQTRDEMKMAKNGLIRKVAPAQGHSAIAMAVPPATLWSMVNQAECIGRVQCTATQRLLPRRRQEIETQPAQLSFSSAASDILRWLDFQEWPTDQPTSVRHEAAADRHYLSKTEMAMPTATEVNDRVPGANRLSLTEGWQVPPMPAVFRPGDGASIPNAFLSKAQRWQRAVSRVLPNSAKPRRCQAAEIMVHLEGRRTGGHAPAPRAIRRIRACPQKEE